MGTPGEGAKTGSRGLGTLSAAPRSLGLRESGFLPPVIVDERGCSREREMARGGKEVRLYILSIMLFSRLTATAEPLGISTGSCRWTIEMMRPGWGSTLLRSASLDRTCHTSPDVY